MIRKGPTTSGIADGSALRRGTSADPGDTMADDDASIDRAVAEATATALRKLQRASDEVAAARSAFERGVGVVSWGSLGDKLTRRDGYRRRFDDLVTALAAAEKAIQRAEGECRGLQRHAGR
jgi:hypothetical protein